MEKEEVREVFRRLANLETHLINLIHPIQEINAVLKSPDMIRNLISLLSRPLNVDDRHLRVLVSDFKETMERFSKDSANLDVAQTYGEIKYIGKRLNEIETTLSEMSKDGVKKKIEIELTLDGHEMVKKTINYEKVDPVKSPDEFTAELLKTLTERESKVIIHRIGLFGEKNKTYVDIAKIFGVSRERVREIYNKGIRRLRHPSRRQLAEKITHKELRKEIFGE